jgi:pimeloyl-ACP methyl ester carboxylesterase
MDSSSAEQARPVLVFVHGMYMTPASWQGWRAHFEVLGYETLAPSWPGREGAPAALRKRPDPALRDLQLADVVEVYRQAIADLGDREVVLVGHSMGGLVVQLLLQEQLAVAGVAISSAPPKGISSTQWSFLRSNAPVLWPSNAPIQPSVGSFHYAFAHTLPIDEVAGIFDTYVVPESRQVGRGPTTAAASIDFANPHPPLLMVAGEDDHIIPASLVAKNAEAYASDTDHLSFSCRTHWIVGQKGWEEVANAVADWIGERLSEVPR